MKYIGRLNDTCPVCNKQFRDGHPVMYRVMGANESGHIWCSDCFFPIYRKFLGTRERLDGMEQFQRDIKDTVDIAHQKISPTTYPSLNGFWFCYFDNHKLGLVLNYSEDEE